MEKKQLSEKCDISRNSSTSEKTLEPFLVPQEAVDLVGLIRLIYLFICLFGVLGGAVG